MTMRRPLQHVTLVGFGAIGRSIFERMAGVAGVTINTLVVAPERVVALQQALGPQVTVCAQVPSSTRLLLECAGHRALAEHVLPALAQGIECAILSIGALAQPGVGEHLSLAAEQGATQLHLLSGAIGAIDALAAARLAGLDEVIYTGRKPPPSWRGTPAEPRFNLDALTAPALLFEGSAREAARLYPKNANVAATVSLAGVGFDATRVRLYADPTVTDNLHTLEARGAFGELHLSLRGRPLADNPKTSALTVLSALRFLHNRATPTTL